MRDNVDIDLNTEFVNNGSLYITWDMPRAFSVSHDGQFDENPLLVAGPYDNQFQPGSTLVRYEFTTQETTQVGVCSFHVNISLGKSKISLSRVVSIRDV